MNSTHGQAQCVSSVPRAAGAAAVRAKGHCSVGAGATGGNTTPGAAHLVIWRVLVAFVHYVCSGSAPIHKAVQFMPWPLLTKRCYMLALLTSVTLHMLHMQAVVTVPGKFNLQTSADRCRRSCTITAGCSAWMHCWDPGGCDDGRDVRPDVYPDQVASKTLNLSMNLL